MDGDSDKVLAECPLNNSLDVNSRLLSDGEMDVDNDKVLAQSPLNNKALWLASINSS